MDIINTTNPPSYPLPQRAELPNLPDPLFWGDNFALSARVFDKTKDVWRVVVVYRYPAFIERFMTGRWVDGRRWSDMPRCLVRYWAGMDGCGTVQIPAACGEQAFLRRAWGQGMYIAKGKPSRLFLDYICQGFYRAQQHGLIVRVDAGETDYD